MITKQEMLDYIAAQEADYKEAYSLYGSVVPPDDAEAMIYVARNKEAYKKWAEICRSIWEVINEADI
jgi:hypothetical protein